MSTSFELLSGIILASLLIEIARWKKQEDHAFGVVLVLAAIYYVHKAILGGSQQDLMLELFGLVIFGSIGVFGLFGWRWVLAAGWALHSTWDIMFHTGAQGAYVPEWYPMLCVGFDLFLAGYIVGIAFLQKDSNKLTEVDRMKL